MCEDFNFQMRNYLTIITIYSLLQIMCRKCEIIILIHVYNYYCNKCSLLFKVHFCIEYNILLINRHSKEHFKF